MKTFVAKCRSFNEDELLKLKQIASEAVKFPPERDVQRTHLKPLNRILELHSGQAITLVDLQLASAAVLMGTIMADRTQKDYITFNKIVGL